MNIHFTSRSKAREYARTNGKQVIDNGPTVPQGKRWACEAVIVKKEPKQPTERMRKRVVVIINADKSQSEENIEQCFAQALDKWKASKPDNNSMRHRHTATAELSATAELPSDAKDQEFKVGDKFLVSNAPLLADWYINQSELGQIRVVSEIIKDDSGGYYQAKTGYCFPPGCMEKVK